MPTFAGKNQMRHGTHFTGLLREASRGVEDWAQKLVIFHGTHLRVQGGLPEWPKGADCKSAAECFGGSNPSPATVSVRPRAACEVLLRTADCASDPGSIRLFRVAPIAQSAERLHGKEKVKGSIPFRGSIASIRMRDEAG